MSEKSNIVEEPRDYELSFKQPMQFLPETNFGQPQRLGITGDGVVLSGDGLAGVQAGFGPDDSRLDVGQPRGKGSLCLLILSSDLIGCTDYVLTPNENILTI